MNKPKVSIVVPIYNGGKYIDSCAANLMKQTYSNLEFILVDDGSSDESAEICDELAVKDSRFRVLHLPNGGPSVARNAGTDAATGEYILYYDVDDDITESLVEENLELAIREDADVVMFSFWYLNLDTGKKWENCATEGFIGGAREFFEQYLLKVLGQELINAPWNKLYKLSFIRENGLKFMPECPVYEDVIYATQMLKCARKIVVNSNPYYVYKVRQTGSQLTRYTEKYFYCVSKFYECAMEYSAMYENNTRQIEGFSSLYAGYVITHLKQISCNRELPEARKRLLIMDIIRDERFQKALKVASLGPRRIPVRTLIGLRCPIGICAMYKILGRYHG